MSRKDNFRKAAFDMFGVGRDPEEQSPGEEERTAPIVEEAVQPGEVKDQAFVEAVRQPEPEIRIPEPPLTPRYQTTVLAEGSVFEGTLRTKGSVDLACQFKGNIFAEGDVVMRTSLEGNVEGKCVELISCAVQGDVKAGSQVKIHSGSNVKGNIATRDLTCSGRVEGDITAAGHVVLEHSAQLTGNLTAATLSIEEGASIEGNIKVSRGK